MIIYRSSDASAPVLSGTVGALTALLKACLVNGYGAKAAAGWGNPFTGAANQETFRPGSGVRHYFHVNDAAPATAQEARVLGHVTATAFNTGTTPFPTANGLIKKSSTADATARAWLLAADDRTCYLMTNWLAANANYGLFGMGEFESVFVGDLYRSFIYTMKETENNSVATDCRFDPSNITTRAGVARSHTGLGATQDVRVRVGYAQAWGTTGAGASEICPFPNPGDGGLHLYEAVLWQIAGAGVAVRGKCRGIFGTPHLGASFAVGDTFDGIAEYAGRSFYVGQPYMGGSFPASKVIFETTTPPVSV